MASDAGGYHAAHETYTGEGTQSLLVTDTLVDASTSVFWNNNDNTKQIIHGSSLTELLTSGASKNASWGGFQTFSIDPETDCIGDLYLSITLNLDTPDTPLDGDLNPKTITTMLQKPSSRDAINDPSKLEPIGWYKRGIKKGDTRPEAGYIGIPNGWLHLKTDANDLSSGFRYAGTGMDAVDSYGLPNDAIELPGITGIHPDSSPRAQAWEDIQDVLKKDTELFKVNDFSCTDTYLDPSDNQKVIHQRDKDVGIGEYLIQDQGRTANNGYDVSSHYIKSVDRARSFRVLDTFYQNGFRNNFTDEYNVPAKTDDNTWTIATLFGDEKLSPITSIAFSGSFLQEPYLTDRRQVSAIFPSTISLAQIQAMQATYNSEFESAMVQVAKDYMYGDWVGNVTSTIVNIPHRNWGWFIIDGYLVSYANEETASLAAGTSPPLWQARDALIARGTWVPKSTLTFQSYPENPDIIARLYLTDDPAPTGFFTYFTQGLGIDRATAYRRGIENSLSLYKMEGGFQNWPGNVSYYSGAISSQHSRYDGVTSYKDKIAVFAHENSRTEYPWWGDAFGNKEDSLSEFIAFPGRSLVTCKLVSSYLGNFILFEFHTPYKIWTRNDGPPRAITPQEMNIYKDSIRSILMQMNDEHLISQGITPPGPTVPAPGTYEQGQAAEESFNSDALADSNSTPFGATIAPAWDVALTKGGSLTAASIAVSIAAFAAAAASAATIVGTAEVVAAGIVGYDSIPTISRLGETITSNGSNFNLGIALAISGDGNTIVIGAPAQGLHSTEEGTAQVLKWTPSTNGDGQWVEMPMYFGQTFESGSGVGDGMGTSVALNHSGGYLAIGTPSTGQVRMYTYLNQPNSWDTNGDPVIGWAEWGNISDGGIGSQKSLAIKTYFDDSTGTSKVMIIAGAVHPAIGGGTGAVHFWEKDLTTYGTSYRTTIPGEAAGDGAGVVAIDSTGDIIAVGAPYNDSESLDGGHVRVWYWDRQASPVIWVQRGSDIVAPAASTAAEIYAAGLSGPSAAGVQVGRSVAMNLAGDIVAFGGYKNLGTTLERGFVRIVEFDPSTGSWLQIGSDLEGEAQGDNYGYSVSISASGHTVAIGSPQYSPVVEGQALSGGGRVIIWDLVYGSWVVRFNIDGEASGDNFGYSVSLSESGSVLAASSPYADNILGSINVSGSVRVYSTMSQTQSAAADIVAAGAAIAGDLVAVADQAQAAAIAAQTVADQANGPAPTQAQAEAQAQLDALPGKHRVFWDVSSINQNTKIILSKMLSISNGAGIFGSTQSVYAPQYPSVRWYSVPEPTGVLTAPSQGISTISGYSGYDLSYPGIAWAILHSQLYNGFGGASLGETSIDFDIHGNLFQKAALTMALAETYGFRDPRAPWEPQIVVQDNPVNDYFKVLDTDTPMYGRLEISIPNSIYKYSEVLIKGPVWAENFKRAMILYSVYTNEPVTYNQDITFVGARHPIGSYSTIITDPNDPNFLSNEALALQEDDGLDVDIILTFNIGFGSIGSGDISSTTQPIVNIAYELVKPSHSLSTIKNKRGHDNIISHTLIPYNEHPILNPYSSSYLPKYLTYTDSQTIKNRGTEYIALKDGKYCLYKSPGILADDLFISYLTKNDIDILVTYYNGDYFGGEGDGSIGYRDLNSALSTTEQQTHTFTTGSYMPSEEGDSIRYVQKIEPVEDPPKRPDNLVFYQSDHNGYCTAISSDGNTYAVSQGRMYGDEWEAGRFTTTKSVEYLALKQAYDVADIDHYVASLNRHVDGSQAAMDAVSSTLAALNVAKEALSAARATEASPGRVRRPGLVRVYKKKNGSWVLNKIFRTSSSKLASKPRGHIWAVSDGYNSHVKLSGNGNRIVIGDAGGDNNSFSTYDYNISSETWTKVDEVQAGLPQTVVPVDAKLAGWYSRVTDLKRNHGLTLPLDYIFGSEFGSTLSLSDDGNRIALYYVAWEVWDNLNMASPIADYDIGPHCVKIYDWLQDATGGFRWIEDTYLTTEPILNKGREYDTRGFPPPSQQAYADYTHDIIANKGRPPHRDAYRRHMSVDNGTLALSEPARALQAQGMLAGQLLSDDEKGRISEHKFSGSLALSGDGNTYVVGNSNNVGGKGVNVYRKSGYTWNKIYSEPADITPQIPDYRDQDESIRSFGQGQADLLLDAYGHSVAINYDGTRFASCYINHRNGSSKIFIYDASAAGGFTLSKTLIGEENDNMGYSLSFNRDGTKLVAGTPRGYNVAYGHTKKKRTRDPVTEGKAEYTQGMQTANTAYPYGAGRVDWMLSDYFKGGGYAPEEAREINARYLEDLGGHFSDTLAGAIEGFMDFGSDAARGQRSYRAREANGAIHLFELINGDWVSSPERPFSAVSGERNPTDQKSWPGTMGIYGYYEGTADCLGVSVAMDGMGNTIIAGAPFMSTIGKVQEKLDWYPGGGMTAAYSIHAEGETTVIEDGDPVSSVLLADTTLRSHTRETEEEVGRSYVFNLDTYIYGAPSEQLPIKDPTAKNMSNVDGYNMVNDAQGRLNHDITDFIDLPEPGQPIKWDKQFTSVPIGANYPPLRGDYQVPEWADSDLTSKVKFPLLNVIKKIEILVDEKVWQTINHSDLLAIYSTEMTESSYKTIGTNSSGRLRNDGTRQANTSGRWVPGKKYDLTIPIPGFTSGVNPRFNNFTKNDENGFLAGLTDSSNFKVRVYYNDLQNVWNTNNVSAMQGYRAPIYNVPHETVKIEDGIDSSGNNSSLVSRGARYSVTGTSSGTGLYVTNVPEPWTPGITFDTKMYGQKIIMNRDELKQLKNTPGGITKKIIKSQNANNVFNGALYNKPINIELDYISMYSSHLIINLKYTNPYNSPYLKTAQLFLNSKPFAKLDQGLMRGISNKSLGLYANEYNMDNISLDPSGGNYVFPLANKAFGGSSIQFSSFDTIRLELIFESAELTDNNGLLADIVDINVTVRGLSKITYKNGVSSISD